MMLNVVLANIFSQCKN